MGERSARVGVLDIGCFSAHLVIVDRDEGSPLRPLVSHKIRLRIDQMTDPAGRISAHGIDLVTAAVSQARRRLRRVDTVVAFATSSIRDATNAEHVIRKITRRTGIRIQTFSGEQEAHLSYIAARHWFGHAAGPLTVLDVGGGTIELASGRGAQPLVTHSLPFGARTLTHSRLDKDIDLAGLRATVVEQVRNAFPQKGFEGQAVGCSKVLQQLARLTGARPQREGPFIPRHLQLTDLHEWIPRLADLGPPQRAELPGISDHRAHQSLAGAVLAEALLTVTGHQSIQICPWSTKEGLLLSILDNRTRH
jgi:exopolyphosphatase / guanosine-5'-triphosphate,3'-diphosphate pyrophosphatase